MSTKALNHPTFEKGRCASIVLNGKDIGVIGEVSSKIKDEYKIRVPVVCFEMSLSDSIL